MIVKEEQWILTVTVTVKSMIGPFMMTVMIMLSYEETVYRMIGTEDTSTQMPSGLNMCSKTSVSNCEYLKTVSHQRIPLHSY
jgi:hypothetical protein